jgi:hypothetical protein
MDQSSDIASAVSPIKNPTPDGVGFFIAVRESKNQMQQSGGLLLAASSMAATPLSPSIPGRRRKRFPYGSFC